MSPDEFEKWQAEWQREWDDWPQEWEKWCISTDAGLKRLMMNLLGASPREADELVAMTNNDRFEDEVLGKHGSIEGWLGERRGRA